MTTLYRLDRRAHLLTPAELKAFLVDEAAIVGPEDWQRAIAAIRGGGLASDIIDQLEKLPAAWAGQISPGQHALTRFQVEVLLSGNGHPLRIEQFVLLSFLQQGGMGRVFLARDCKLDRLVALKLIRDEGPLDERVLSLFQREMRLMASIEHPHVARLYDGSSDHDGPFVAMEYVAGDDLAKHIRDVHSSGKSIPLDWAIDRIVPVAEALNQIHSRQIVHRDIKPSNLILRDDGDRLVIIDFGIARKPGYTLTADGDMFRGSGPYAPGEQWQDPAHVTAAADVYALGATFFEILSGRPPFVAGNLGELMQLHCKAERPRVRAIRPDIPEEICQLIQSMMAIDPARRPNDLQVIEQLANWRNRSSAGLSPSWLVTHGQLLAILPEYIRRLERNSAVGALRRMAWPVANELRKMTVDQNLKLFMLAGEKVGPNSCESGPERGLLVLVQTFWEINELRVAMDYAVRALRYYPQCFTLNHFAGAIARMIGQPAEQREALLREAIRYEEQAQTLPNAQKQRDYCASLATLAQAQHQLAVLRGRRGDRASRDAMLAESLRRFEQALAVNRNALRLANYGQALRDAGRAEQALAAAREACEKEWFIREGQELFLELLAGGGKAASNSLEEHFRRWSLVEGEFDEDPHRQKYLQQYFSFLEQQRLWPAIVARTGSQVATLPADLESRCRQAALGVMKLQCAFPIRAREEAKLTCNCHLWKFSDGEAFLVIGVPELRTYLRAPTENGCAKLLRDWLLLLHQKLEYSRWTHPPFLDETCRQWLQAHVA